MREEWSLYTGTGEPGSRVAVEGPTGLETGEAEFQGQKQAGQGSGTTKAETGWRQGGGRGGSKPGGRRNTGKSCMRR